MITGLDLVEWQILVARGERLPLLQQDIASSGSGIEFRLYAEDPMRFLPSPGKITTLNWNQTEGIRIDCGYEEGGVVTPFYDPMIAKCIFHGKTRQAALAAAGRFFENVQISGIKTNAPLFVDMLANEDFKKGIYTTNFLTRNIVK